MRQLFIASAMLWLTMPVAGQSALEDARFEVASVKPSPAGSIRNFVCEAVTVLVPSFFVCPWMMRVGAVGNRVVCGFPRRGGRVLGVHGDGSVHARLAHSTLAGETNRSR